MSAWFKKKYPNKQTRLHLFCPPFLQNGHLIIYIFQGLVKISVTEDGVSRALPPSLLFSPGKSFDFILGNIFQIKPRFGWGFHKKKITFQTQSLAWRLRKKMERGRCIYSTVLFHDMFSQQISASPSLNTLWFPQRSAHIHLCLGNKHKWLSSLGIGPELFQEKAPPEICASLDVRFASQVFCLVDLLQLHHIMCKHKHSQNLAEKHFLFLQNL